MGRHATGLTRLYLGELVAARAIMERCRDFADPACRPVSVGMKEDPYVATLGNLAVTLALLGYLDRRTVATEGGTIGGPAARACSYASHCARFCSWHDWLTSSPEWKGHAEELLCCLEASTVFRFIQHGTDIPWSLLTQSWASQEAMTLIMRADNECTVLLGSV